MGRTLLESDPFVVRMTLLGLMFINNPQQESIMEVSIELQIKRYFSNTVM
jgi:hypothetical protein